MLLVCPEGRAESGLSQLYRTLVDCSAASWLISTRDVVLGLKTNSGIRHHLVRFDWRQVALTHLPKTSRPAFTLMKAGVYS